tara:strand:+ start:94 stop:654 length:561 start_codon:yes stop_codon:yes gene_type:complete
VTTDEESKDMELLPEDFVGMDVAGLTSKYRPEMGQAVCVLIREGLTLKQIVDRLPIKSVTTIYHWRRSQSDFKEAFALAKQDAADTYADKVLEVAQLEGIPKEDVPGERLKVESYKWLAEKANPQRYSPKSVIAADEDNPLQILIDTGIGRDQPIKAEYTGIDDTIAIDEKGKPDNKDGDDGVGSE